MSDLIERLPERPSKHEKGSTGWIIDQLNCHDEIDVMVADALEAAQQRIERLEGALKRADDVREAIIDMMPLTDEPPLKSQCRTLADAVWEYDKVRATLEGEEG